VYVVDRVPYRPGANNGQKDRRAGELNAIYTIDRNLKRLTLVWSLLNVFIVDLPYGINQVNVLSANA